MATTQNIFTQIAAPVMGGIWGTHALLYLTFGIAAAVQTAKLRKVDPNHNNPLTVRALWTTIVGWLLIGVPYANLPFHWAGIGLATTALKDIKAGKSI